MNVDLLLLLSSSSSQPVRHLHLRLTPNPLLTFLFTIKLLLFAFSHPHQKSKRSEFLITFFAFRNYNNAPRRLWVRIPGLRPLLRRICILSPCPPAFSPGTSLPRLTSTASANCLQAPVQARRAVCLALVMKWRLVRGVTPPSHPGSWHRLQCPPPTRCDAEHRKSGGDWRRTGGTRVCRLSAAKYY